MNRVQQIQKAENFIQWLDQQIDGLEISADRRHRLAAGCLEMALEHQRAILLLIANNLNGSAFALARLIFETYVRGIWLHQCATDAELEKFVGSKDIGTFSELCSAVEKLEGYSSGVLSEVKARSWKAMCGFTHTGIQQVACRNTETTIEANYDEAEILEVIDFACAMGWLVAIGICGVAENDVLANTILQRVKELYPREQSVLGSSSIRKASTA